MLRLSAGDYDAFATVQYTAVYEYKYMAHSTAHTGETKKKIGKKKKILRTFNQLIAFMYVFTFCSLIATLPKEKRKKNSRAIIQIPVIVFSFFFFLLLHI